MSSASQIESQLGHGQRRVGDSRARGARELANAVDRVVIVDGQEQPSARRERIRLADMLQGAGRVGGEDRRVVAGRVEPLEDGAARAFDELSRS